jgi:hypothetical protein
MRPLITILAGVTGFMMFLLIVADPHNVGGAGRTSSDPFASTFSIVAIDLTTGDVGVAVQSKFPNVRPIVPWAEAGVGAIATQSFMFRTAQKGWRCFVTALVQRKR